MPKGENCPHCSAQTFHRVDGGGRFCTTCLTRGFWPEDNPSGGGGKGRKCGHCDGHSLVQVDDQRPEMRYCRNCKVVVVLPPV